MIIALRSAPSALLSALLGVAVLVTAPALLAQEAAPAPIEGTDYMVYEGDGDAASLADILRAFDRAEAVLVGEQHDDMVGHGFQYELLAAAVGRFQEGTDRTRPVVLSLEMFERDVQYIVDEYLEGLISETHFLRSSRPWDEYESRYRPMVELARERGLPVVAANAPRRYVSRVTSEGPESLEALSEAAKQFLPPLPYPGPSDPYRAEWDALMSEAMAAQAAASEAAGGGGPQHMPNANALYSQALWDAAMGHGVTTALEEHPGAIVLHMAGSFHVQNGTGIPERIRDYRPETRQLRIVMVAVDDVREWDDDEYEKLGDFVVLTKKPATAERPIS